LSKKTTKILSFTSSNANILSINVKTQTAQKAQKNKKGDIMIIIYHHITLKA